MQSHVKMTAWKARVRGLGGGGGGQGHSILLSTTLLLLFFFGDGEWQSCKRNGEEAAEHLTLREQHHQLRKLSVRKK